MALLVIVTLNISKNIMRTFITIIYINGDVTTLLSLDWCIHNDITLISRLQYTLILRDVLTNCKLTHVF